MPRSLQWLPEVRPPERGRATWLALLGVGYTLTQTVGLAGAEALFLARLGAGRLPVTFVLASAATVVASLLYALRVGRARNDRILLELLAISVLGIGAAGVGVHVGQRAALPALLCLYYVTQALLTTHYWTLVSDLFDTLASKRLVALFTVGMSAGGAVGGGIAVAVLARSGAEALIWTWAVGTAAIGVAVVAARGPLARWHSVTTSEEEEASVEGLRASLRYLRGSALARWLVLSALAMVLALFVVQYLYSDIFARTFPDERRLAAFLALYLMLSNGVEIVVEGAITPWLIRRAGVPAANLVHPVLTLLTFAGLILDPRLVAAVAARADRELLDNALSSPVRSLVYNALPDRFRSRMRVFLEGVVIYSGMSLAGLALLAAGALGVRPLAAAGVGLAGLYGFANVRVRRAYAGALAADLRAGRLELGVVRAGLGPRELAELAAAWTHLLAQEREDPSDTLLALPSLLAERGLVAPVRQALAHPSSRVRAACLAALATSGADADPMPWRAGLADPAPEVRATAAGAVPSAVRGDPAFEQALEACLADPDPTVRARAGAQLGARGAAALAAMQDSAEPEVVLAALEALPPSLAASAARDLDAGDPRLRAAALDALARSLPPAPVPLAMLIRRAADPDPRVRASAVRVLAARPEAGVVELLAGALADEVREVREAAVAGLAARGTEGVEAARARLRAPGESTVGAALRVLGSARDPAARSWLRAELVARVREAWEALLLVRAFSPGGPAATAQAEHPLLQVACSDAYARALRLSFRVLLQLEDPGVVRSVQRALRFAGGRSRADALELLSHLGDREAGAALAVLLERSPVERKLAPLQGLGRAPRDPEEALARARALGAPWVRVAAGAAADSEPGGPVSPAALEASMQRLLVLRQVSLFSGLSLERLQAVERIVRESRYVGGEAIVREGEPGDELFLIIEGEVDVLRAAGTSAEERLNRLGPGDYLGEMAVLDGSPRSTTAVARSEVRALVLAGARLRELMHEMPDLAFDLLRVLAARVRRAEARAPGALR
jgi:HEAT repeat protein